MRPQHIGATAAQLRDAIDEYRRLFRPQQIEQMRRFREVALQAMQRLAAFEPRLCGALLHGDGPLNHVRLLLRADTAEHVIMRLSDLHIPWRSGETTLIHAGNRQVAWPTLRFLAGDAQIELVVLPLDAVSDPPRDALSRQRLDTLDEAQLTALLDADQRASMGT